jgi:alpha/beta hydrolase family protein
VNVACYHQTDQRGWSGDVRCSLFEVGWPSLKPTNMLDFSGFKTNKLMGDAVSHLRTGMVLATTIIALTQPAYAKVVKFEILRTESPAFEGRIFGTVGTYDRIIARATVAVAPDDPHNSIIVDIERAPRNAQGLVEATSDVEILRPTVPSNGNRTLLYDVLNRGRKLGLTILDDMGIINDLVKSGDAGNGFLMSRGYTVVWSGWQGDLDATSGPLTFTAPIVPDIVASAREEFIFDHLDNPAVATLSYPAADLDPSHARITVREREADPRSTPTDLSLKFESPVRVTITRPTSFDAGAIYELIYQAKDPKVMGLGFAATRDIVSFLHHAPANAADYPNVLSGQIDRTIGFGVSQSGRFLHDFLYLGFNTDEAGRSVFDGLIPHIAGGKKTFVNYRFGQPGRHAQQHAETVFPGGEFPFTYPVITDALTGRTDGILVRCLQAANCPKIFHVDTELEFYQSRASLIATDTRGEALTMPDNVRLFLLSNLQHFALANAKSVSIKACAYPTNPLNAGPPLRALLVALDAWITNATPPPASRFPSRADGTLVPPAPEAVGFPQIPGVGYTGLVTRPTVINFDVIPPVKGASYPVFVPKTDSDGRDIAGIHLPTLEAPIATHTGWNLRKVGFAEGELCDLNGSMLPFAATRDERIKNNDNRLSLAERYPQEGDRTTAVALAAKRLVQDRLLLEEDVKLYVALP